jgi:hypothetical protein
MITCRDPAAMTITEQVGEIAEILATAYLRLRHKCLEVSANHEALCHSTADIAGEVPVQERVA